MSTRSTLSPFLALTTFGELLKYLRRREQLTQRELALAVGYTEAHISRLEQNQRLPDLATLAALFVPALHLDQEPQVVARLMELAAAARGQSLSGSGKLTLTHSVTQEITETIEAIDVLPRHNLPVTLTSFIGREAELAQVKQALRRDEGSPGPVSRVITLTGAGGSGKTRLALHAAAQLLSAFPDGVWWVELASLTDPSLVPATVAHIWGVREGAGQTILDALTDYVRGKTLLLVLDNGEHLVAACAYLAETLSQVGTGVRILTTSREYLNLPGETVIQVPPLTVPDPAQPESLTDLEQYEAVRLFTERAAATLPGFTLTENNAAAIAHICYHLDGIPLALELAAARVHLLQVEEIAARLTHRFHLLAGGNRTVLPRHQTLRSLIDWSYNLLSEPEREMLQRLTVFAGGWTVATAEAVLGEFFLTPGAILDLLTQLVHKSLVIVERKPGAAAHFHLLETIREYAHEKLVASGLAGEPLTRHLDYFLNLAETANPALHSHEQISWLNRLDADRDNFRAALGRADQQHDAIAMLRLSGALFPFWFIRGYVSEGQSWLKAALSLAQTDATAEADLHRARVHLGLGRLARFQGDYPVAQTHLEAALHLYRTLAIPSGIGNTLCALAEIPFWQGDYARARPLYEEGLSYLQQAGEQTGIGNTLYGLGLVAQRSGDPIASRTLLEKSVAILRQAGNQWSLTYPLGYLAWAVWLQGDPHQARAFFEEGLAVYQQLGDRAGITTNLSNLAVMAAVHGDFATATAYEESALAIGRELGSKWHIAWSLCRLGEVAYWQGQLVQARTLYEQSLGMFQAMAEREASSLLWRNLARVCYQEGDYDQAVGLLEQSLEAMRQMGLKAYTPYALLALAEVTRLQGDGVNAAAYYRQSLTLLHENGIVLEIADRLEGLAKVAVSQGEYWRAVLLLGAAQAQRTQLGTPLPPVERDDYERNRARAEMGVGKDEFAAAWREGLTLSLAQAIDLALG